MDNVNHPSHYTSGHIECIDAIRAALTDEEYRGYCKGNAMKYIWRERHKGQDESLEKGNWYLDAAIDDNRYCEECGMPLPEHKMDCNYKWSAT